MQALSRKIGNKLLPRQNLQLDPALRAELPFAVGAVRVSISEVVEQSESVDPPGLVAP